MNWAALFASLWRSDLPGNLNSCQTRGIENNGLPQKGAKRAKKGFGFARFCS
jgi:hypothetical protein